MGHRLDFAKFPGFIVIVRERGEEEREWSIGCRLDLSVMDWHGFSWWIIFLQVHSTNNKHALIWMSHIFPTMHFSETWDLWINVQSNCRLLSKYHGNAQTDVPNKQDIFAKTCWWSPIRKRDFTKNLCCSANPQTDDQRTCFFEFLNGDKQASVWRKTWIVQSKNKTNMCLVWNLPTSCWWNIDAMWP